MKKKLFAVFTALSALMAILIIPVCAEDAVLYAPDAADGWRCTETIVSFDTERGMEPLEKHVYIYDDQGILTESLTYFMQYDESTYTPTDWAEQPWDHTIYSYNAAGLLETETTYLCTDDEQTGQSCSVFYTYDDFGRCTEKLTNDYGSTGCCSTYTYDRLGRVSREVYSTWREQENCYILDYTYVGNTDQLADTTNHNSYGNQGWTTTYRYSVAGQCVGDTTYLDSIDERVIQRAYQYNYDVYGNKISDTCRDQMSLPYDGNLRTYFIETYSYERVDGGEASSESFFADVTDTDAYYYTPVLWAVRNGVTAGTSDTTFSPDASCSRAAVVSFLYRAAGSPDIPSGSRNPFTDVHADDYYYDAVLWAVSKGITFGTSATTFSPDAVCTRADAVTFLYRAAGGPAVIGGSRFTDVKAGDYYYSAVLWASQSGVTAGADDSHFEPASFCTRGQFAAFLYRDAQN